MKKRARRNHTPAFKAKVALAALQSKTKEGSALPDEVETARMQIVDSLRERRAYYDQYSIEHTVSIILGCYRDLAHERGLASYDREFPSAFVYYSMERI